MRFSTICSSEFALILVRFQEYDFYNAHPPGDEKDQVRDFKY